MPLSKGAIANLRRQPKTNRSQIVFHRADGKTMDWVSSQFGATARRLASKWSQKWSHRGHPFVRFKFHDLRHLFAVRYLRDGGGIYALQGILGHTSVKTTEIYLAFLTPDQQHAAKLG